MKTMLLAAGVAATVLSAGSALAATKHHAMGGAVAPPKQPIPYAELNSYLKASPAQRARKDWWSGQMASTGTSANTSASSSAGGAASSSSTPAMSNDTPTGAGASSASTGATNGTANGMPMATGSAAGAADATAAPSESNMPGPDNLRDKNAATPSTSTDRPH